MPNATWNAIGTNFFMFKRLQNAWHFIATAFGISVKNMAMTAGLLCKE
jgi:hypothetical protein